MLRQYKLSDYRFRLVLWVAALSILGILVIGSANQSYQRQQIAGMILGIVVMVIVSLFDYKWVLNFYWLIYLAAAFGGNGPEREPSPMPAVSAGLWQL